MKQYHGIRTKSFPPYSSSDVGTGRCRLSPISFGQLNINMGCVLQISLSLQNNSNIMVICTAWNDTLELLDENTICIDDAVVSVLPSAWIEGSCTVINVYNPKIAASVYSTTVTDVSGACLRSLAVCAGYTVQTSRNRPKPIHITAVSPTSIAIVSNTTVVSLGRHSNTNTTNSAVESEFPVSENDVSSANAVCSTSLVQDLIRLVVLPSISLPPQALLRGVMLLGPPGVGKSYAARALKKLCQSWCKIILHEFSVTSALSDSDPLSYAERILSKCGQWGTTSSSSSTSTATATPTTKSNTTTNTNTSRRVSLDNDRDSDIDSTPSSYSTPYSKSKPISPRTNDFNTGPSSSISYSSATKNSVAISPLRPQTLEMSQSPGLSPNTATATASTANVRSGYVHTPSPSPSPFRHEAPSKASLSSSTALSRGTANELPVLNILLIDEIDALGGRSDDSSSDIQLALKAILCAWMDKQSDVHDPDNGHKPSSSLLLLKPKVVIFGTSNRAEDVDPVLRRGGRLEMEIEVSGSGVGDRSRLIKSLLDKSLPPALQSLGIIRGPHHPHPDDNNNDGDGDGYDYNPSLDLTDFVDDMAEITGGYVAADLIALVSEAVKLLIAMDMSNNNNNFIQGGDSTNKSHVLELELLKMCFQKARRVVLPSCLRGATITLPSLRMSDVIGHEEAKKSLLSILSLSAPSAASRRRQKLFGLTSSSVGGALLWGPPGNSKTRLVLAVASERGLPVVSLGSADVFSPYVGDAEASIRRAFRLARQSSPCVLLLDELDALVGNRDNETSVSAESRVLATLLSEMDGIGGSSHGVIVLGATNRLDSIDAALLRKGRFHQLLHVPCPNENDRIALLEYFCRRSGLSDGNIQNDLKTSLRAGMSGADVENVCREAAMSCLRDIVNKTNVM